MKVISIANHKGGVGKTTSTINIGAALSLLGYKVLLIDLDAQANLSQSLGVLSPQLTIYDNIRKGGRLHTIPLWKGLDIVPSTLDLSGAEIEISSEAGREYILKELIDGVAGEYDCVFIDCPPSLGLLTINAFTASDEVIIPLQAQYLALQGLAKLLDIIEKVRNRLNKKLKLGGVFVTQYDGRKILNREILQSIESHFSETIYKSRIRDNVALAEAPARGLDIFRYNKRSNGALDYRALAREIAKRSGISKQSKQSK